MYSIRRRLLLILAAGFTALIIGTGIYVVGVMRERITAEFDQALLTKAGALKALTDEDKGRIELDYTPQIMPEFERNDRPDYFQFWLDDGRVLHRSSGLAKDVSLPRVDSFTTHPPRDIDLPDGRRGRLVQLAFVPRSDDDADDVDDPVDANTIGPASGTRGLVLVVARGREPIETFMARMRLAIFGVGGVSVILAVFFVWRALVAGFRPVVSIANQVRELDADSLDASVRLARTPVEVAPIVDQLNGLLHRLNDSFERERRFTGNVAHELRTPIAELRSLAEVGAKWPEDKASVVGFFDDVNDIAGRMESVIADLLLLARCQAGVEKVERSPTSLWHVISTTWSRLSQAASSSGLRFHLDLPEDLVVESDPGKLSIVFANVLGNAVSYARPNSEIRCVGKTEADGLRLDIINTADPLDPTDFESLAEPFWRKDKARSSAEHAGLGLSVVAALAGLLRLDVGFDQDRDGTFRVRLVGWAFANG